MLWIRHVPNTTLLISTMRSKRSFYYLPNNILFCNSQNLSLVTVFDNCSLLPAIHHFIRFVWAALTSVNGKEQSYDIPRYSDKLI